MSCNNCLLNYNYINNGYCLMCNIIHNTKQTDILLFVIGISSLSQLEIITLTKQFIMKNNCVPLPNQIDKDVKIIKDVNHYLFKKYINKTKENNFKIFFTNQLNIDKIKVFRIFDKKIINQEKIIKTHNIDDKIIKKYTNFLKCITKENTNNVTSLFI